MKLQLRHASVLVVAALVAVLAYELFWLSGLYRSERQRMRKDVAEAVRRADSRELGHRVRHDWKKLHIGKEGDMRFSFNYYQYTHLDGNFSKAVRRVYFDKPLLTADGVSRYLGNRGESDEIGAFMQRGLHTYVDAETDIDMLYLDSCLTEELERAGIHGPHQLLYLYNKVEAGDSVPRTDTLTVVGKPLEGRTEVYDQPVDMVIDTFYRVVVPSSTMAVLGRMGGIVLVSLLTMLLIAVVMVWLMRVIRQQKTLDMMKSDFTNNMTHELKTPIAVAYAANDAMLNYGAAGDAAKAHRYLTVVRQQLDRLSGLVEQILSMGMDRRESLRLRMEEVDVASVVRPLVDELKMKADKPVDVTLNVATGLTVHTDRAQLRHIMDNLLDNAVKYSNGKADITVRAYRRGEETVVEVGDHGIGIDHDGQRHVFDRFYRVPHGDRQDVKGYGLGLYYVETMMRRLGGSVTVHSRGEGQGTTFRLRFPKGNP